MSALKFHRPVVFFDLETTGTDPIQDRIVQVSMIRYDQLGIIDVINELVNPGIPIPPAATQVHGITDEAVANAQPFVKIADKIVRFLSGCDVAGYNIVFFDLPLLTEELGRCNIDFDLSQVNIIDVFLLYKKLRPRTLEAAYRDYVGGSFDNAHDASADTAATLAVLQGMMDKEKSFPGDAESLMRFVIDKEAMVDLSGKFIWNEQGEMLFNFGPQKGSYVIDNPGMLRWMIGKNFPRETMKWVYAVLNDPSVTHKSTSGVTGCNTLPFGDPS